eukprot:3328714-Pyramimonas_sp.AAC.2
MHGTNDPIAGSDRVVQPAYPSIVNARAFRALGGDTDAHLWSCALLLPSAGGLATLRGAGTATTKGEELNAPVVEMLNRGLMDNP